MSSERVAVVGCGQTHHRKVRDDLSMAGLLREAAERALADAGMDWTDIDAVVIGKAPDTFEGVMMPELYLADALGAAGKPMMRVHTAGSVGGSTAVMCGSMTAKALMAAAVAVADDETWPTQCPAATRSFSRSCRAVS